MQNAISNCLVEVSAVAVAIAVTTTHMPHTTLVRG